jgi:hypothetical protein
MNAAAWAERYGVGRVTAGATGELIPVDKVVVEVGSALNGHRRKFLALLRDPTVNRIGGIGTGSAGSAPNTSKPFWAPVW